MPEVPKRGWPEAGPQPSPEQMQMAAAQLAQQVPLPRPDPRAGSPEPTESRGGLAEAMEYPELAAAAGFEDIGMRWLGPRGEKELKSTEEDREGAATKLFSGVRAHVNPERFSEAQRSWPESKKVEDALGLTEQERALYDRHLSNLHGPGGVDNPDGSRSTLLRVSFEADGKFYNVPSVYDGKVLSPKAAIDRAVKEGLDRFPSYPTQKEADARYDLMHRYMEDDTKDYYRRRPRRSTISDEDRRRLEEMMKR